MIKTYSELIKLPTFEERFRYLKLDGQIGIETFGFDRYLNQAFYRSREWQLLRNEIIVRDHGCDLGIEGRDIYGRIVIHHMNPINEKEIYHRDDSIMDPELLITVSLSTHNAIHYGDESILYSGPITRGPNDTCPWRK